MSTIHITVFGAAGRMGARLCALCASDDAIALEGAIVREGSALIGRASAANVLYSTEKTVRSGHIAPRVVIDFSSPVGAGAALAHALARRAALLVGTTGLDEKILEDLRRASSSIAVLVAPNTSLGVAALCDAAARLARLLGPAYRASVVESHHAMKKDAPSGTAKRIATAVRGAGGDLPEDQVVSIRGGDVIGEHTLRFAGPGEYIELTHRATTRDLFALGALRAARWLATCQPGWYTIEDAVGIPSAAKADPRR